MSSSFRKAQINFSSTPNGWAVVQRGRGAWMKLPMDKKWRAVSEKEADEAVARSPGIQLQEIPASWWALPTGVDLQVHLRHPGQPQKETLEGGLESALLGGYDAIVTMPNTNPFLDEPEHLRAAIESAKAVTANYPVKVFFTASATKGMQGLEPSDIPALGRGGAVAITDDGWGVKSADAQAAIFSACAKEDLLFQQHAEMPGHKGVATASRFQASEQLPEYPRTAESEMIRRDLEILRKYPRAKYHVLHVSTRESLELIRAAKAEGLRVTAEVTPHHLLFSSEDIPPQNHPHSTYFKMNPPLFGRPDRDALRAALRDGTIDCVSTDHAPHETENKAKGWTLSPFGTRGLETALPALLTLVQEGELSLARLVEVFSSRPREILGHAGANEPSGLLFAAPESYEVRLADLPGISENSCFLGKKLHGKIKFRCENDGIYKFQ